MDDDSAVVNKLLEFGSGILALMKSEISLSASVDGIDRSASRALGQRKRQIIGRSRSQSVDSLLRLLAVKRDVGPDDGQPVVIE